MQGLNGSAQHVLPSLLVLGLFSFGKPCVAQEVPPVGSTGGTGSVSGSVVAPSGWLVVNLPVHEQLTLKFYGFYIGELKVPVGQFELAIRTHKFLTITPSYMYYWVPASGLNKMAPLPGGYPESYDEHQFRIDGNSLVSFGNFEVYARIMYVRRVRPAPADDINRYRGRIDIARPFEVKGQRWRPFAAYEAYYERDGGWIKDRVWTGVTLPLMQHVKVEPSYMWESSPGVKDIHYLLLGLRITTNSPRKGAS